MNTIDCLVQANGTATGHEPELERRLRDHHDSFYPGSVVSVSWRAAKPGQMFTAGSPSHTSVIACELAEETSRACRKWYMRGICDLWTEVTGCTDRDLLVSIAGPD